MMGPNEIKHWFTYHKPKEGQPEKYEAIREAGKNLAEVIIANTPGSADQSAAVRKVREACMTANSSIACDGV